VGSQRGATPGDTWPHAATEAAGERHAGPRAATCGDSWSVHGMQEVRGSNPRSSTAGHGHYSNSEPVIGPLLRGNPRAGLAAVRLLTCGDLRSAASVAAQRLGDAQEVASSGYRGLPRIAQRHALRTARSSASPVPARERHRNGLRRWWPPRSRGPCEQPAAARGTQLWGRCRAVGADNAFTSCDLGVLLEETAKPVASWFRQIGD
jgi:hypothetical protein